MKTNTFTSTESTINSGYETSKFALAAAFIMAALVGVWASACMVSGLVNGGFGELVKGFITAVSGA